MDSQLYKDPRVIEATRKFVFIRIDIDNNQDIPSHFGVTSIPARVIIDPWETVLASAKGSTTAEALLDMMKAIPESFEPVSEYFTALVQDPNDADALDRIADFYRKAGYGSQADAFHARSEKATGTAKKSVAPDESRRATVLPEPQTRIPIETIPYDIPESFLSPRPGANAPPRPTSVVDLPNGELLAKYPGELLGVEFDAGQDELDFLLKKVGENVKTFFGTIPNTASKEHIRQELLRENGRTANHVEQDVEYLLILRMSEAELKWNEERTDSKGKTVKLKRLPGKSFLTSGFALECVLFYPGYQKTIRYRYLGRQSSPPYAHLIAFAQVPERGGVPGQFNTDHFSVTVWGQGLAWVDPKSYQIVRMKIDLLQPRPEAGLSRQTTEITYAEYRFSTMGSSFWLPREVFVTIGFRNEIFRNTHRYSGYKLFTVESFEKHEPASRPPVQQ
jgi:hypothetical protein